MHRNQFTDAPKIELPEVVDARTLAGLLGLNQRTVRKLADKRILVRRARGQYELDASVKGFIEHCRRPPPVAFSFDFDAVRDEFQN